MALKTYWLNTYTTEAEGIKTREPAEISIALAKSESDLRRCENAWLIAKAKCNCLSQGLKPLLVLAYQAGA